MADNYNYTYVGKSMPLHDARDKVTGAVKYTGDLVFPGMLHAKILFSPLPHARVLNVDGAAALALPGVQGVFSHFNAPRVLYNSQQWYAGQKNIEDEMLFAETARFIGDRVAAVVATDKQTAQRALSLLHVEYEELQAIFDPEEALRERGPLLQQERGCGRIEEAFATAPLVVQDRVITPKIHHAAMETHVCIAVPEAGGRLTLHVPCQMAFSVRLLVARILGMPFNKVRVVKPPMGGSFGGKQEVILEPVCAFMAATLGKPVCLELDRQESIVSTRSRTRTIGTVRMALDKTGTILGREVDIIADAGAYTSNGAAVSAAMLKKLSRLYRIQNQTGKVSAVFTNTPVAGAARGYGGPQVHAITEINMDHAARVLGLDPLSFRLKNLAQPYDEDPSGGPPLGNIRIRDCLIKGALEFGWQARRQELAGGNTGRYRRGIGLACAGHNNGGYGGGQEFTAMNLKMLEDGTLLLSSGLHELGCGTIISIKQIIAEVMGVPPNRIEAPEVDTQTSPYDSGSQASRVTFVCGACARKAAQSLLSMLQKEGAKILQCSPEAVQTEAGRIWSRLDPQRKLSFGEIAALIQNENQVELSVTEAYQAQGNPVACGVNFCEVEVDTLTGRVKVLEVVAVHDVGKAINPGLVEGQIHGGIQMGMGMALWEDLDIDPKTGRTRGDCLGRYHMVNAPDMPPVKVFLIEEGEDFGPFGAKSIGEVCTVPTAPAIVNAVNHALGTHLTVLPLTPERILLAKEVL